MKVLKVIAVGWLALVVTIGVVAFGSTPAAAHGGGDEAAPVDLVEQALAILVNTPDAVGEVIERVEEALVEEGEAPSGDLDLVALEEALSALEDGRSHDAEDALIAALGQDPHDDEPEPADPEAAPPADTDEPAEPDDPATTPDEPVAEEPSDPAMEEDEQLLDHGLTSRVEGGFVGPASSDVVTLVVALVLLGGGLAVLRGRGGAR